MPVKPRFGGPLQSPDYYQAVSGVIAVLRDYNTLTTIAGHLNAQTHPYSIGLLYHIVLTAKKGCVVEDRKVYRKAVELLCKKLRTKGMPCRYKACYERDKKKRFHKHMFILIEAKDVHPDSIIHYKQGDWFTEMLSSLDLAFKIAEPRNPSKMHYVAGKQVNYAYVPKKASPKLDDCLVWISYLYKARSKDGVEGQIYTGSTNREPKPPVSDSSPAALPAAKEEASAAEVTSASIEAPVAQPIRIDRVFPPVPLFSTGRRTSDTRAGAITSASKKGRLFGIYQTIP